MVGVRGGGWCVLCGKGCLLGQGGGGLWLTGGLGLTGGMDRDGGGMHPWVVEEGWEDQLPTCCDIMHD